MLTLGLDTTLRQFFRLNTTLRQFLGLRLVLVIIYIGLGYSSIGKTMTRDLRFRPAMMWITL